jgi:hypothetical protein
MRVVVILAVLSIGLGIAAYRVKKTMPEVSQALLGFSILFAVMLFAAFFNLI